MISLLLVSKSETPPCLWLCANIFLGGSAAAAGKLVEQLGGNLIGYLFILELSFLKGRDKLKAPAMTLLSDD
jgi:adenine phosphoribosyltransferase